MKNIHAEKRERRNRRHARVRARVSGTAERPRLAVFKSNQYIYAQLIDDTKAHTLAEASSLSHKDLQKKTLREQARAVGTLIAEKAKKQGIDTVVFDRGGFSFAGIIREVAEGAREGGLIM